jgi:hypothetical protein
MKRPSWYEKHIKRTGKIVWDKGFNHYCPIHHIWYHSSNHKECPLCAKKLTLFQKIIKVITESPGPAP